MRVRISLPSPLGPVVQRLERPPVTREVVGSNPIRIANRKNDMKQLKDPRRMRVERILYKGVEITEEEFRELLRKRLEKAQSNK